MSTKNELFERMMQKEVISLDVEKLSECEEQDIIQILEVIKDYNLKFSCYKLWLRALQNEYTEVVKLLLEENLVDPSAYDNYAIRYASEKGDTEVVKLLLKDDRVDPASWDNYAIRYASCFGYVEVVKLLLDDKRVDPSACDNYAIRDASYSGHAEVVRLLLQDERVKSTVDKKYII